MHIASGSPRPFLDTIREAKVGRYARVKDELRRPSHLKSALINVPHTGVPFLHALRAVQSPYVRPVDSSLRHISETDVPGITRTLAHLTYFDIANLHTVGPYQIKREGTRFELVLKDGQCDDHGELKKALLEDLFVVNVGSGARRVFRIGFSSLLKVEKTMSALRDSGVRIDVSWAEMIRKWFGSCSFDAERFLNNYCEEVKDPERGGVHFFAKKVIEMRSQSGISGGVFSLNYVSRSTKQQSAGGGLSKKVSSGELHVTDQNRGIQSKITNASQENDDLYEDTLRALIQEWEFVNHKLGLDNGFPHLMRWHRFPTLYQLDEYFSDRLSEAQDLEHVKEIVLDILNKKNKIEELYVDALIKIFPDIKARHADKYGVATLSEEITSLVPSLRDLNNRLKQKRIEVKDSEKIQLEVIKKKDIEYQIATFSIALEEKEGPASRALRDKKTPDMVSYFQFVNRQMTVEATEDVQMAKNELILKSVNRVFENLSEFIESVDALKDSSEQLNDTLSFIQTLCYALDQETSSSVMMTSYKERLEEFRGNLIQWVDQANQKGKAINIAKINAEIQDHFQQADNTLESVDPQHIVGFMNQWATVWTRYDYPEVKASLNECLLKLLERVDVFRQSLNKCEDKKTIGRSIEKLNTISESIVGSEPFQTEYLSAIQDAIVVSQNRIKQIENDAKIKRVYQLNRIILGSRSVNYLRYESLDQSAVLAAQLARSLTTDTKDVLNAYKEVAREVLAFFYKQDSPHSDAVQSKIVTTWQVAFEWSHSNRSVTSCTQILAEPMVQAAISVLDANRKTELLNHIQDVFTRMSLSNLESLFNHAVGAIEASRSSGLMEPYPSFLKDNILRFDHTVHGHSEIAYDKPLFLSTRLAAIGVIVEGKPTQMSGCEVEIDGRMISFSDVPTNICTSISKKDYDNATKPQKNALRALGNYFYELKRLLPKSTSDDPSQMEKLTRFANDLSKHTPPSNSSSRVGTVAASILAFKESFTTVSSFISTNNGNNTKKTLQRAFENIGNNPSLYQLDVEFTHTSHPGLGSKREVESALLELRSHIHTMCMTTTGFLDPQYLGNQCVDVRGCSEIPLLGLHDCQSRCALLNLIYEHSVLEVILNKWDEPAYVNRLKAEGWASFPIPHDQSKSFMATLEHMLLVSIKMARSPQPVIFTKEQGKGLRLFANAKPGKIEEFIAATGNGKTFLASRMPQLLNRSVLILSPIPVPGVSQMPRHSPPSSEGHAYPVQWMKMDDFDAISNYEPFKEMIIVMDECDMSAFNPIRQNVLNANKNAHLLTICGMSGTKSLSIMMLEAVALWQRVAQSKRDSDSRMEAVDAKLVVKMNRANDVVLTVFSQMLKLFGNDNAKVSFYKDESDQGALLGQLISQIVDAFNHPHKTGRLIQNYRLNLVKTGSEPDDILEEDLINIIQSILETGKSCRATWVDPVSGEKISREITKISGDSHVVTPVIDFRSESEIANYPYPILSFYFKHQERGTDFGDQSNFTYANYMTMVSGPLTQSMSSLLQMAGRMRRVTADGDLYADVKWPEFSQETSERTTKQTLLAHLINDQLTHASQLAREYSDKIADQKFRVAIEKGFSAWLDQQRDYLIEDCPDCTKEAAIQVLKGLKKEEFFLQILSASVTQIKAEILRGERGAETRIHETGEVLTADPRILYFSYEHWIAVYDHAWRVGGLKTQFFETLDKTITKDLEVALLKAPAFSKDLLVSFEWLLEPDYFQHFLAANYNGTTGFDFYDLCRALSKEVVDSRVFKYKEMFPNDTHISPRVRLKNRLNAIIKVTKVVKGIVGETPFSLCQIELKSDNDTKALDIKITVPSAKTARPIVRHVECDAFQRERRYVSESFLPNERAEYIHNRIREQGYVDAINESIPQSFREIRKDWLNRVDYFLCDESTKMKLRKKPTEVNTSIIAKTLWRHTFSSGISGANSEKGIEELLNYFNAVHIFMQMQVFRKSLLDHSEQRGRSSRRSVTTPDQKGSVDQRAPRSGSRNRTLGTMPNEREHLAPQEKMYEEIFPLYLNQDISMEILQFWLERFRDCESVEVFLNEFKRFITEDSEKIARYIIDFQDTKMQTDLNESQLGSSSRRKSKAVEQNWKKREIIPLVKTVCEQSVQNTVDSWISDRTPTIGCASANTSYSLLLSDSELASASSASAYDSDAVPPNHTNDIVKKMRTKSVMGGASSAIQQKTWHRCNLELDLSQIGGL